MRKDKKRIIRRVVQVILSVVITTAIIAALFYATQGRDIPVLDPKGTIANQQQILILITVGLGIFVVVPVFILLFGIAWKYREGNEKAKYDPDLHGDVRMEIVWWGVPALIIVVLAVITWISTFALDPYKPLESDKPHLKVQVVALEWKWLFIYPEQGVATVNYLNIPEKTPIEFFISADAPMNSFWIPALAGQVYAMPGMTTKLHIMADGIGSYKGVSANLSGEGYAGMRFTVNSLSDDDFASWVKQSVQSSDWLTPTSYDELRQPGSHAPEKTYGLVQDGMFNSVILKYMAPKTESADERATAEGNK